MKKKLLFMLPSLFALVSCSYGGIAKVSEEAFKAFYNRGDLATQKDRVFKLGDTISASTFGTNEEGEYYLSVDLNTSSIDKWKADGYGNALSFIMYSETSDEDDVITGVEDRVGRLTFSSRIITDEDDEGETIVVGKKEIYTYFNSLELGDSGSMASANSYSFIETEKTVETYYESLNDEGTEFDEDYSYKDYKVHLSMKTKYYTVTDDERNLYESESTAALTYREYYSGSRTDLAFSYSKRDSQTTEKAQGGTYVGSTRVVDEENKTTQTSKGGAVETDTGKSIVKHTEYIYSEGEYHKDDEHSTVVEDDTYRYEVPEGFTEGFATSVLVEEFSTNSNLLSVIETTNKFMKSTFINFETKMNDTELKKEIIHFSDTYQYRISVDDTHIHQYSFVEGENGKDRLTNIVIFEMDGNKTLVETSKSVFLY